MVPKTLPLTVAEQVEVLPLPATRLQGLPVTAAAPPISVAAKVTEPRGLLFPPLWAVTVAVHVLGWLMTTGLAQLMAVVVADRAAARYGPTNGPPLPTGAAPAGCTGSVETSTSERSMLIRPLPVWSCVPAGSALRAMRPTMTPLVRAGSTAFMNAARPATCALEREVPLMTAYEPPAAVVCMSTPGAATKTASPELLHDASRSSRSVAETPMTPRSPAGKVGSLVAALPEAATSTAPFDHA